MRKPSESGTFQFALHSALDQAHVPHSVPFEGTVSQLSPGMELWVIKELRPKNFHPDHGPARIEGSRWHATAFIGNAKLGVDTGRLFKVHVVLASHEAGRRFAAYLDQAHATGRWVGITSLYGATILATVDLVRDDGSVGDGYRMWFSWYTGFGPRLSGCYP